eukprot:9476555-Pyramimonas_sp.AAC.1
MESEPLTVTDLILMLTCFFRRFPNSRKQSDTSGIAMWMSQGLPTDPMDCTSKYYGPPTESNGIPVESKECPKDSYELIEILRTPTDVPRHLWIASGIVWISEGQFEGIL